MVEQHVSGVIFLQDLGATAVFTIFWFAGSCAWAQGVSDVKYYMDPNRILNRIYVCSEMIAECKPNKEEPANYSSLNISVVSTARSDTS